MARNGIPRSHAATPGLGTEGGTPGSGEAMPGAAGRCGKGRQRRHRSRRHRVRARDDGNTAAPDNTATTDNAAREGHDDPTIVVRDPSELDPLLTHYSDAIAHRTRGLSPMMEEIAASLVVSTSGAGTPTAHGVGGLPGFGPIEPADADMFSMLPWDDHTVDVSDNSAACRLKSFTRRVLKKVDSPLIREPLK